MIRMEKKEPVISEGGVYILPPRKGDEIGEPLHSEDLTNRKMEESQISPETLEDMRRYAVLYKAV